MKTNFSNSNFGNNFLTAKFSGIIFLAFFITASFSSCKKDDVAPLGLEQKAVSQGKACFVVDTDFPYYVITYQHAGMDKPAKVQMKNQKHWELCFQATPGDPLLLEVNTITSNLPATQLEARIYFEGNLVKKDAVWAQCTTGNCPTANTAMTLKMTEKAGTK